MGKVDDIKLRVWWRHWSVVFVLVILSGLVIWSMLNLGSWLKILQKQKATAVIQKQLDRFYREDKYGGKTPEETFSLFISALESGDVELASKYFILNKQSSWLKTLDEYKTRSLLPNFISELKNIKNVIKFEKYPSGIWKISSL